MEEGSLVDPPWLKSYETGVPGRLEYPEIGLFGLLDQTTEKYPAKRALRFYLDPHLPASTFTYSQLREAALRLATALSRLGVNKGDRIALMLPNCPEFVIAFFAAMRLGAIAVNTNPLYVAEEMKAQFQDSGCETVILLDRFFPRLREIRPMTRIKRVVVVDLAGTLSRPARAMVHLVQRMKREHVRVRPQSDIFLFERLLTHYPPTPPEVELNPGDTALFQYTGGTTGTPKAAMLSHRNLVSNTLQVRAWFARAVDGEEIVLAAIPFFHVYGMTACMLFGVRAAAELLVLPRPRPIETVMRIVVRCGVTIFPGVPTLYTAINNHPNVTGYDLRSVKLCLSGAAPLPIEVALTFEKLTGGKLVEGFGMTEASPVTHCNPLYGRRKAGSIGLPLPDTEARIVDPATGQSLPPDSEGELVVRGPQVMKGYWNRPEETAGAVRAGWLHTGDIAKMDEEGYFYILDRIKDMIVASGFKVLPREVEEVLFTHPKVREAVVAGVPDPYRGETVKAYIVLKEGQQAAAEEIVEFCKLRMASFKVPKSIEFRKELPKTLVGKILRRALVEEEKERMAGVSPKHRST